MLPFNGIFTTLVWHNKKTFRNEIFGHLPNNSDFLRNIVMFPKSACCYKSGLFKFNCSFFCASLCATEIGQLTASADDVPV